MDEETKEKGKNKKQLSPALDFVAGTIAGIVGIVIAHPFDTVKVRFQNTATTAKYRSTIHALSTIYKEERFRGLYKGITSPMLSCAPLNGVVFASFHAQLPAGEPTLGQIVLAGMGAGIVGSVITCPVELVKIRQQNIIDKQPSTWSVARDIFQKSGTRGLYRGLAPTILRDFGYGAYFATYEGACRYLSRRGFRTSDVDITDHTSLIYEAEAELHILSWPALLVAGGLAGVNGWLFTFAFDVVKTRMQSVEYNASHPTKSIVSTIASSYRAEGWRVFFRGLSPTLFRAIPVNMATFGVFELAVHLLS